MDHNVDESLKGGPEKLLEERWFFGNLLDKKTRMLRTTTSSDQENLPVRKSYEEIYESIKRRSGHDSESRPSNLMMRAPSMPPCMERKDSNDQTKGGDPSGRRKLTNRKTSLSNLLGAPSPPTSLGAHESEDEEEMEFSMGKLIRQASLNINSHIMPQKKHAAKGVRASRSISAGKPEEDGLKLEKITLQRLSSKLKAQKSLSALEFEELQGFKDLGVDFDNKNSNRGVISIINEDLQEQKKGEEDEEKSLRRTHSWAWGGKRTSTEEDMIKAQIKFWARAVASNVRPE